MRKNNNLTNKEQKYIFAFKLSNFGALLYSIYTVLFLSHTFKIELLMSNILTTSFILIPFLLSNKEDVYFYNNIFRKDYIKESLKTIIFIIFLLIIGFSINYLLKIYLNFVFSNILYKYFNMFYLYLGLNIIGDIIMLPILTKLYIHFFGMK